MIKQKIYMYNRFKKGSQMKVLGHIKKPRMLLNQRSWLFMRTIVYTDFNTKGANVDAAAFILAGLVL